MVRTSQAATPPPRGRQAEAARNDAANGVKGHVGLSTDAPIPALQEFGKRYRETIFNFAKHREPEAYRLIVERKGAIPPPEQ